jgi:hypothetical protein
MLPRRRLREQDGSANVQGHWSDQEYSYSGNGETNYLVYKWKDTISFCNAA